MNFRKHGLSFHCYADETQVYLPVKLMASLMACLADVKDWFSLNFLIFLKIKLKLLFFVCLFFLLKDFEKVIHTFILSRLDYCNSLHFGIRQTAISRLRKTLQLDFWVGLKRGSILLPFFAHYIGCLLVLEWILKLCSLFINLEMVWPLPIFVSYWLSINRLDPFGHPTRIYCLPLSRGLSAGERCF